MDSYTGFAEVYDTFMDNVPYDEWANQLKQMFHENGIDQGLICELGCGTGNMTRRLAAMGYDMIGIDLSTEMLEVAQEKQAAEGTQILYLCQDMTDFELYGTVNAIYAVCDSLNYVTEAEDVRQVIALADNYLDPSGLFVFDLRTDYFYSQIGQETIADHRENGSFIWENDYQEEERLNIYDMTFYIADDEDPEVYRRFQETHYTRAHDPKMIRQMILDEGMEFLGMCDGDTMGPVTEESLRIYMMARECKKTDIPGQLKSDL